MILNKFKRVPLAARLKTISLQVIALSLFSCNKTANINANKAFVSFTHVAYQVDPLTLIISGDTVFKDIPYDSATGHPYATVTSRVSNTDITENNDSFLSGFLSLRQGAYYSIYVYDTLDSHTKSMIILQDNPPLNSDTTVSVRYMNFTPSTNIGLLLINTRHGINPNAYDSIVISQKGFVGTGTNTNPASYIFQPVLAGNFNITAMADSARPAPDSSNFRFMGNYTLDISSNYNFNLMGFGNADSNSIYKFQLRVVPLN